MSHQIRALKVIEYENQIAAIEAEIRRMTNGLSTLPLSQRENEEWHIQQRHMEIAKLRAKIDAALRG